MKLLLLILALTGAHWFANTYLDGSEVFKLVVFMLGLLVAVGMKPVELKITFMHLVTLTGIVIALYLYFSIGVK